MQKTTRLRQLRLEQGLSGFELGRRARVNPSDVSALELGRRRPTAGAPMLRRLARALKYKGDPADLLRSEVDDDRHS